MELTDILLDVLSLFKKEELNLGEELVIKVPIPKYVGGIRGREEGGLLTFGNKFEERDLNGFVKLRGYKGTFRVIYETEGWDGFYHVQLVRENTPRNYKDKIVKIKKFN